MPGLNHFSGCLHHFVLFKLATTSIRVKRADILRTFTQSRCSCFCIFDMRKLEWIATSSFKFLLSTTTTIAKYKYFLKSNFPINFLQHKDNVYASFSSATSRLNRQHVVVYVGGKRTTRKNNHLNPGHW